MFLILESENDKDIIRCKQALEFHAATPRVITNLFK